MARTLMAGLALAMTLGVASVSQAQQVEKPRENGKHGEHAQHMKRGPRALGFLLKGIDLTDQQKAQLKALREQNAPEKADREKFKQQREAWKAARERGDSAAIKQFREQAAQRMQEMKEHRQDVVSQVRNVLTPEQRAIFDKNVAEAQKRMEQHKGQRDRRGGARRG